MTPDQAVEVLKVLRDIDTTLFWLLVLFVVRMFIKA